MVEDDYPPAGSGWTRPSGAPPPLQLTTDFKDDDRGRETESLGKRTPAPPGIWPSSGHFGV
jgi:hypothetical protein